MCLCFVVVVINYCWDDDVGGASGQSVLVVLVVVCILFVVFFLPFCV